MIITAKFASICPSCRCSITPGDKVEWERGQKATHTVCPSSPSGGARKSSLKVADPEMVLREQGREWAGDPREWEFTRQVRPGDLILVKEAPYMVLEVGARRYHSESDCEDFDCFCGIYGWRWQGTIRPVTQTAGELDRQAAAAQQLAEKVADEAAAKAKATELRRCPEGWVVLDSVPWRHAPDGSGEAFWAALPENGGELIGEVRDGGWSYRLSQIGPIRILDTSSYDDSRTVAFLPPDQAPKYLDLAAVGISKEEAAEWLEKYRGCVGTSVREWVVGQS